MNDINISSIIHFKRGAEAYNKRRLVFNRLAEYYPAYIFCPKDEMEIREVILFAGRLGYTISVKNGGHSAYGQSISDGGITIDMSEFKKMELSNDGKYVTIGGGVLSGELDLFLSRWNLAVPLGDCPDVGVCGLALGGGNGMLSRKYGLTCDQMVSARVATAEGNIITVSNDQYPALFKALKSAGQNHFGVISELTFKTIQLPPKVTIYNYYWPLRSTEPACLAFEELMQSYPTLGLYPRLNRERSTQGNIRIYGLYPDTGSISQKIKEQLDAIPNAIESHSHEATYYQAQQINVSSIKPNLQFHWENAVVNFAIDRNIARSVVNRFRACPGPLGRVNIESISGRISAADTGDSAFIHRSATYIISAIGIWQGKDLEHEMKLWTKSCIEDLVGSSSYPSYQNYANPGKPIKAYFGNYSNELKQLKNRWDPANLFEGILYQK